MTEPLTPEEEAALRVELLAGTEDWTDEMTDTVEVGHLRRLLATLDAARAGVREPEGVFWDEKAHEIEAAASRPAPDPSTALDVERLARALPPGDPALISGTPENKAWHKDAKPRPAPDSTTALRDLIDHYDALAGPRGHRLGCECGGTNDGIHSCRSLSKAFVLARAGVRDPEEPRPALPPGDPALISGTPENKAWHKAAKTVPAPDPSTALREAAQAILDRALDFFDPDDLDEDSSLAMPVTLKARHVAALRAALTPEPREDAS